MHIIIYILHIDWRFAKKSFWDQAVRQKDFLQSTLHNSKVKYGFADSLKLAVLFIQVFQLISVYFASVNYSQIIFLPNLYFLNEIEDRIEL